jgi:hypothetical protein
MLSLKKVGDEQYDAEWRKVGEPDTDYHIRAEHKGQRKYWTVDAFDSTIKDPDVAHKGSEIVGRFQDAIDFILEGGFRPPV